MSLLQVPSSLAGRVSSVRGPVPIPSRWCVHAHGSGGVRGVPSEEE